MEQPTTVFVICGVYNNLDYTKDMLKSLAKQSYPYRQTIIIDDGSTDGTAEYLRDSYPAITLIQGSGKLWWTGSMHRGVAEVLRVAKPGDFVLTMNNDCIFESDYIETLVRTSEQHDRAIVGSLAVDRGDRTTIWDGGVQIDWQKGIFKGLGPKRVGDLPRNVQVLTAIDTLSTKGTLYPVEVFKQVGNFDQRHLPHYGSDYEMACRARRAGFQLLLSYQARVYNDTTRTGFGETRTSRLSFIEFYRLMFSRRSQVNIVDHWQLVRLICPPRYKPLNYLRVVGKFLNYLFDVPPFTVIPWAVLRLKRLLGIEHVSLVKLLGLWHK